MSRVDEKNKKATRRKKTIAVENKRDKIAKAYGFNRKTEKGRFKKRHPLDCGKSRCGLCHGHKRFGLESVSEKRAKQKDKYE